MFATHLTPNDHLRRLGAALWETTGGDPQFVVRRGALGPRYLMVELEALERPLDAAVYLRDGAHFSEARRIDLPERRRVLLAVSLNQAAGTDRIRIDPAETDETRFRLRTARFRTARGLLGAVRARLTACPDVIAEIVGPDPGLRGRLPRARVPAIGRPSEPGHIRQIWEMARIEAALEPLAPPKGVEISFVVPVYNARAAWLSDLLQSVLGQGPGVELVLVDDGSRSAETAHWLAAHDGTRGVRVLRLGGNRGVAAATNAGILAARGTWIGLLDHDDALAPHAVDRIRRALSAHPDARFLYTDEVIADADLRPVSAFWKPAFDPVLLSGVNYVNHLSLYRRERLIRLGGLAEDVEGSQDYDLVLRYTLGLTAGEVLHLPYPAYLWRQLATSLSHSRRDQATDAARRALARHFEPLAGPPKVEPAAVPDLHRVRFPRFRRPFVSVVIPNRNSYPLIARVLSDLRSRTDYGRLEIVVVDNGSTDPRVHALYAEHAARPGFRAEIRPEPFNFARMINRGATLARGEAILLLNNDVSVREPGWLDEMVDCLAYPDTGVVGARLLFPDGSLQHAGVMLGLGGLAGHWYYRASPEEPGPMGRLQLRNSLSVVTGACMLVTRDCWQAIGGMDADAFAVAYNDVDFCARARHAGYGVIWTPFATLVHHESASRGSDRTGEKARRFEREKAALAARHGTGEFCDPAFSPWYSRFQSRPRLTLPDRLPGPRSFHANLVPKAEAAKTTDGLRQMPRSA
ncbi:MAG: glycosyltransferase family 2 protein [Paracoccaceae bacterium]